MKAISIALTALVSLTTTAQVHADAGLAKSKNCMSCHAEDKVLVGPAYKLIAKKYAGKQGTEAALAERIIKGTGPAGQGWNKEGKAALAVMPPNPNVNADEARKLVKWILSIK